MVIFRLSNPQEICETQEIRPFSRSHCRNLEIARNLSFLFTKWIKMLFFFVDTIAYIGAPCIL